MPDRKSNRSLTAGEPATKRVSEERFQGVLENVFGLKIPAVQPFESDEEQHYAGALENIYGVRLPSEMVARAYSIFIKEYKKG